MSFFLVSFFLRHSVESLSYMTAADSMGLSVFVFTRLFSKAKQKKLLDRQARKQNLTENNHSRSFKLTCFETGGKPTKDSRSLHNNVNLTSKGSEL